jgi:hypothetical protein
MARAHALRIVPTRARLFPAGLALWLGLCFGSTAAVEAPTCEQIRAQAKNYTMKQIAALAKRARLTPEQWAQVQTCLKDKR